jgi:hypothetical protein
MRVTTTVPASPQCLRALERANEVRLARADLKHQVAAGTVSAADVVLSPPAEIAGMTIADLLMSQRHWGQGRCRALLTAVALSEVKTVGSMTDRQRRVLATLLAAPEPPGSASPIL